MTRLAVLLSAASLAAFPALAGEDQNASLIRGKVIVEEYCAGCHATGSEGESPFPPAPPFREIVQRYPVEYLEETFAEGTSVGHPAMPTFEFEADQISDLLAYLDSLAE